MSCTPSFFVSARSVEHLDVAFRAVHADSLSIANQASRVRDSDDSGKPVFTRNHRAVRHLPADLRDEALDRDEQRRPARIRERRDEDVAGLDVGLRRIEHDARTSLDGACRDSDASKRAGRQIVAAIGAVEHLAIRRQHPRRREPPVCFERIASRADDVVVDRVGANSVVQILKRQEESVFDVVQHARRHEPRGLAQ